MNRKSLIIGLLAAAVLSLLGMSVSAQIPVTSDVTGVTANNVNLRELPSTSAVVLDVVPYDTLVPLLALDPTRTWVAVSYNNRLGWISLSYVDDVEGELTSLPVESTLYEDDEAEEETEEAPSGVTFTIASDGYLYTSQTTNAPRLATVPAGATLIATAINSEFNWLVAYYDGITGWIRYDDEVTVIDGQLLDLPTSTALFSVPPGDLLTDEYYEEITDSAAVVQVGDVNLNMRGSATTDSRVRDVIPAETELPVFAISPDYAWLLVAYDGRYGWVSRSYVSVLEGQLIDLPVSETAFF